VKKLTTHLVIAGMTIGLATAQADVVRKELAEDNIFVRVTNADWQPDGFVNGITVPATHLLSETISIDGRGDDKEWALATEVTVPLRHGSVIEASIKAVYTDDEVILKVRWPDATENRAHHPWTWDEGSQAYVAGPQVEDSVMLSFEAGCEWAPSLLQGYVYDFDGWHWLAARSDPVGQAWDLDGTVQNQMIEGLNFRPFAARKTGMDWNLKFVDRNDASIMNDDWDQLHRMYLYRRAGDTVYIRAEPDRMRTTNAAAQLPPPSEAPATEGLTFPQFEAVKLEGDAGEVTAKGHWENGFWTVEFRRDLITPADTSTDWVFVRLSQFSIYVFDGVEHLDQAAESPRLFLRFMPKERLMVGD